MSSDKEGAIVSDAGALWADRWGIQLDPRPITAHARMIERHNKILRDVLHRISGQLEEDQVEVPDEVIVAEAMMVKNCTISVHGHTPQVALLGRQPALLQTLEPESTALAEDGSGIAGISKHIHRLREVAVASMVAGTARNRLEIAEDSKTRPFGEGLELQIGDLVDFWRQPPNRDVSGWQGPSEVCDLGRTHEGTVSSRWQGRVMDHRVGDVRRSLVVDVLFNVHTYYEDGREESFTYLLRFTEDWSRRAYT